MAKPNLLNSVKLSSPKKSVFDLSHDVKLSCNMAQLIPVMCKEVVPSDQFQCSQEALMRLAPMVAPMMHRCDVSFHTFFVPDRLLWPNFDKWITNQKIAGTLPAHPFVKIAHSGAGTEQVTGGSLMDYFGLPLTNVALTETEIVSALPLAAYQMIYNEYYRDQNQEAELGFELTDGDNTANTELFALRRRAWEHDYFTAAAPEAQVGDPVSLPLGSVQLKSTWAADGDVPNFIRESGTGVTGAVSQGGPPPLEINVGVDTERNAYDPDGSLEVGSTTINDLRTAFRLQEWLEKSMRGGRRLFENILVFFGLRSPDSRLQRPEYIYGSKTPIQVSEVLNTTGTDDAPQGQMAGHGIAVVQPKAGYYKVQEWGHIITIMSVLPRTAYQQGIDRMWLKHQDPMQKYWPQFDHLGEQEITNNELFAYTEEIPGTFGYIPRYAEYKFSNSRVAGQFRTTLAFWHMGRIFSSLPALNGDFIAADPTHRVFAVTDEEEHKLFVHVYNKVRAIRPMSKYSTPSF